MQSPFEWLLFLLYFCSVFRDERHVNNIINTRKVWRAWVPTNAFTIRLQHKIFATMKKNLHLCGMNSNIKVKYIIPCSQPLKVEQLLHKLLKIYRVGTSEWHLISEDKLEEKLIILNGELYRYK